MDERTLRDGMHDAVENEPPMNIDPDRVVDEARRTQRRRRATAGAGVATLAVLAGVAAIPGMTGAQQSEVTPAAPKVVESSPSKAAQLPLPGVVPNEREKPNGGEIDYPDWHPDQHDEDVARYTVSAVSAVAPNADDVRLANAHVPYSKTGVRTLRITVGFTDAVGPTSTSLKVYPPGTVRGTPADYCRSRPGDERTRVQCRVIPHVDGSVLVSSVADLHEGPKGALVRTVRHYRSNGAVVQASAYTFNPERPDPNRMRERPALDEQQLSDLVTDPRITLKK